MKTTSFFRQWRGALLLFCVVPLLSACSEKAANPDTQPDPVVVDTLRVGRALYLTFDGSFADSSLANLNGDVDNVEFVADRFGDSNRAGSFNGQNSRIAYHNVPTDSTGKALTLAAWVYPTARKTGMIIACGTAMQGPYWLGVSTVGETVFGMGNSEGAHYPGYKLNTWMFVAATYDGSRVRLYVNGVLADSGQGPVTMAPTRNLPVFIGSRMRWDSDTFDGMIDDVMIYSRTLSSDEIMKLYNLKRK